jgi:tetratricopeptide (TPR) repeat protein
MNALLLWLVLQEGARMLETADKTFHQRQYAEAMELYTKAAEAGEREKNAQVRVEALAQVARCLSLLEKLDEGRTWLAKAEAIASKDEPLGWSRFLGVRGIFERESGDRKKARATFEEMYAYCVERRLPRRAADAAHHVAIVVPPEEQPAWALKGIAEAEKVGDEGWLAVLWNNLGVTYEDLKQYDQCLDAYLKAQKYHHRTGTDHHKLVADWAVAHGQRLCGKLREAREGLERTLAWAGKRHAKEPNAETLEWVGWCKKDLGETLAAQGEKDKGLALLKEGRQALVEAGIEKWWPEGLKQIDASIHSLEKKP